MKTANSFLWTVVSNNGSSINWEHRLWNRIERNTYASDCSSCMRSFFAVIFLTVLVFCWDQDVYFAPPLPEFGDAPANQSVPVIRIFGPTPGGQKACLHIHGVSLFTFCISQTYVCLPGASILLCSIALCSDRRPINLSWTVPARLWG